MSRYGYGGGGGSHSNNGYPSSYSGMFNRYDRRNFDNRPGSYYDYYDYPNPPYPHGPPGRFEPYAPRMMPDGRPVRQGRPAADDKGMNHSGYMTSNAAHSLQRRPNARRVVGRRTSAVQFTASRSRLKPPFIISQNKWGNSNRSSWIFPRFGDYIDTKDTPIWLTEEDLISKFDLPKDNQYCPDCGVLVINAKRHKTSDFHKEKLQEKSGVTPKWKIELMERKKKYEERKLMSTANGDVNQLNTKDEDSNDDEEEENGSLGANEDTRPMDGTNDEDSEQASNNHLSVENGDEAMEMSGDGEGVADQ